MSEVAKAAERLRELQCSELFSVEPDGDKRAIATRGIGVTWELWQKCKAVISWALPLLDENNPLVHDLAVEIIGNALRWSNDGTTRQSVMVAEVKRIIRERLLDRKAASDKITGAGGGTPASLNTANL